MYSKGIIRLLMLFLCLYRCNSKEMKEDIEGKEYFGMVLNLISNISSSLADIAESTKQNSVIGKFSKMASEEGVSYPEQIDGRSAPDEKDCESLLKLGFKKSGVYQIWPKYMQHPMKVYCDMETDGGGWIVFQRRGDFAEQLNFYEGWEKYKNGFGNLTGEFWLGNEALFVLTNQASMTLRIDMEDFDNQTRYARYRDFMVRSELEKYRLNVGQYSGNAGDSLSYHNNQPFSTKGGFNLCPQKFSGAWWYDNCHHSNLNGLYLRRKHESFADGVNWKEFRGYHYSLKSTEMKLRSH